MKRFCQNSCGLIASMLLALPAGALDPSTSISTAEKEQVQLPDALNAPYPAETSIPELTARQMHYEALRSYLARTNAVINSRELNLAEKLAAAKSAWALGLVQTARKLWDQAFEDPSFQGPERTRAMLARSILELQEGECSEAQSFAARGMKDVEDSDLKAQFNLVRGEAMRSQKAYAQALNEYSQAMSVGNQDSKAEAAFLAAKTQLAMGRQQDARAMLTKIETESSFAARGLRMLAEIDLANQNYRGVLTWLTEAREGFSSEFQDAWSHYGLVSAYSELGRFDDAEKELKSFQINYSAADSWYALAEATYEIERWKAEAPAVAAGDDSSKVKIDTKGQRISDVEQRTK